MSSHDDLRNDPTKSVQTPGGGSREATGAAPATPQHAGAAALGDMSSRSATSAQGNAESGDAESNPTLPMAQTPQVSGRHGWALGPGDLLAERFRIVQFLGRGGMGEVYEAEDLELGERVALKTIRPELAADDRVLERFKREIHLARQVTHPNACRIYDLFRHRSPSWPGTVSAPGAFAGSATTNPSAMQTTPAGSTPATADARLPPTATPTPGGRPDRAGEITFLTMELLPGETLAARLTRDGALPLSLVGEIACQMASALDAAHAAGVVHRDFKSANVQLLPARAPDPYTVRVKVTDFGLARSASEEAAGASHLTQLEEMIGTPAYMSPEQVEGERLGPPTDVYAFGVVLYEMVTGKLPFVGSTAMSTAVKRLSEPPRPPRLLRPDLPARVDETILRCLARRAEDRWPSAGAAAAFLTGDHSSAPTAAARSQAGRRRLFGLLALLLLVSGAVGWLLQPREPAGEPTASAAQAARRTVAVLAFRNLTGRPDSAWLSTALVEMLRTELAGGGQLRTIPGENVSRMERDLGLAVGEDLGPDTLGRIRAVVGADLVLLGSYLAQGDPGSSQIRLDLRLQDARSGNPIDQLAINGSEAELLELIADAGSALRASLGLLTSVDGDRGRLLAMLPGSPEAARLYAEGLDALRQADVVRAREVLERAVAAAPDSPLVRAALAAAWTGAGYDGRALEAARQAFELAKDLPDEQRLAVEGRYRTAAKEWVAAVAIYQQLVDRYPDDLEYGLLLAEALTSQGNAQQALTVVERLRRLAEPASADPAIDLAEARVAQALADYPRQHRAAAAALAKGERLGAKLVVANARLAEGAAAAAEGNAAVAAESYELAKQAFAAAGDQRGVARTVNQLGNLAWTEGDTERARGLWSEALATQQSIGDRAGAARNLGNLAMATEVSGDLAGGLALWEQAIAEQREVDDRVALGKSYGNLAILYRQLGRLEQAEAMQRQALELKRALADRRGAAFSLFNLGNLLVSSGRPDEAQTAFEESVAIRRELGEVDNVGVTLVGLSTLRRLRVDLQGARAALDEAESVSATPTRELLRKISRERASLALLAGKVDEADRRLSELLNELSPGQTEAISLTMLRAEVLLDGGVAAESSGAANPTNLETSLRQALTAARGAGTADHVAWGEILLTRALAAAGRGEEATRQLAVARASLTQPPGEVKLPLAVALAAAEVALVVDQPAAKREARRAALALVPTAKAQGHGVDAYRLRLLAGALGMALGEPSAGNELSTLAAEATGQGLLAIAARADALRRGELGVGAAGS